jgi:hypothetical protein
MKYAILFLYFILASCGSDQWGNMVARQQMDSARMADSLKIADSLAQIDRTATEKVKSDSMNTLAACPELKNYMAMSRHIANLTNSTENAEALRKKFKQLSDSLIVMETEIFAHTYKDLDRSCQELFLDRMKKNAAEISDGFNRKVYTK